MREPVVSIWSVGSGNKKRWVCQARMRPLGRKPITVQRRHSVKTVAFERALAAISTASQPKSESGVLTVNDLLDRYLRSLEGTLKDTTLGEYAYQLRRYFQGNFSDRALPSISPEDIRIHLKGLLSQGLSVSTVNTIRTRVSGMFAFAVREELTDKNPASLVKPFRLDPRKATLVQQPWTLSEARSALTASENDELNLFLVLSLFTGLRRGESTALTWADFNESEKTLTISKNLVVSRSWRQGGITTGTFLQTPKTTSSRRTVFCGDQVIKAIYRARRRFVEQIGRLPWPEDPLIFRKDGRPFVPSSIGQKFTKFCSRNSLRRIRVHDLRHTSAVFALEAGVPLEAVSEGLGHSGVDITKRIYAPKVPGLAKRFASGIGDYIEPSNKEETVLPGKRAQNV
jgi:integrase